MPKSRRKRNPIWFIPLIDLKDVVKTAVTLSSALRHFGLSAEGYNHGILKTRLNREGIDYSHIQLGMGHNKGRIFLKTAALSKEQALDEIFIENSEWSRNSVKTYLKRYNLLPYRCKCGLEAEWQGEKLSLQLDHENGKREDHRLCNLRWLCPNCHSQTPTFSGKANKRKPPRPSELDPINFRKITGIKLRKYTRPSKEELEKLVWQESMTSVAKRYGMNHHNTVRRWCKAYGIVSPPLGYWKRRSEGYSHEESLTDLPKPISKPEYMSSEKEAEVIRLYRDGHTLRSIARLTNFYRQGISLCLQRHNVSLRKGWKDTKRCATI